MDKKEEHRFIEFLRQEGNIFLDYAYPKDGTKKKRLEREEAKICFMAGLQRAIHLYAVYGSNRTSDTGVDNSTDSNEK